MGEGQGKYMGEQRKKERRIGGGMTWRQKEGVEG